MCSSAPSSSSSKNWYLRVDWFVEIRLYWLNWYMVLTYKCFVKETTNHGQIYDHREVLHIHFQCCQILHKLIESRSFDTHKNGVIWRNMIVLESEERNWKQLLYVNEERTKEPPPQNKKTAKLAHLHLPAPVTFFLPFWLLASYTYCIPNVVALKMKISHMKILFAMNSKFQWNCWIQLRHTHLAFSYL